MFINLWARTAQCAAGACLIFTVAGCSPPFHRTSELGNYNILAVDATQRLVITGTRNEFVRDSHGNIRHDQYGNPLRYQRQVICTEPSPDALVATAAAYESSFSSGDDRARVAGAVSEAVSNLGTRTQTIQLLRDGYFRVCEAYLNGAVDFEEYKLIIRAIDHFMITLVAIEAVAGHPINISVPVSAPPVVLPNVGDNAAEGAVQVTVAQPPDTSAAITELARQLGRLADAQSGDSGAANAITNIVAQYFALIREMPLR